MGRFQKIRIQICSKIKIQKPGKEIEIQKPRGKEKQKQKQVEITCPRKRRCITKTKQTGRKQRKTHVKKPISQGVIYRNNFCLNLDVFFCRLVSCLYLA